MLYDFKPTKVMATISITTATISKARIVTTFISAITRTKLVGATRTFTTTVKFTTVAASVGIESTVAVGAWIASA